MAQADAAIPVGLALRGSAARRRREAIVRAVLLAAALSSIVISAFIVYTVAFEAAKFLTSIDLSDLVAIGWFPRRGMFDISTLLLGTLMVTAIAMARRHAGRPCQRDLPRPSTQRPGPARRQADHRDPGRHPERRPGVLRPDVHQPEASSRASSQRRRRSRSWRRAWPLASCRSRWSRPSPRTRCGPCPGRSGKRRTASGRGD